MASKIPSYTEVHTTSPIAAGLPVLEVVRRLEEEKLITRDDRTALKDGLYSSDVVRREEIVNALCEVELSMNSKFSIRRLKAIIHQNGGGEVSSRTQNNQNSTSNNGASRPSKYRMKPSVASGVVQNSPEYSSPETSPVQHRATSKSLGNIGEATKLFSTPIGTTIQSARDSVSDTISPTVKTSRSRGDDSSTSGVGTGRRGQNSTTQPGTAEYIPSGLVPLTPGASSSSGAGGVPPVQHHSTSQPQKSSRVSPYRLVHNSNNNAGSSNNTSPQQGDYSPNGYHGGTAQSTAGMVSARGPPTGLNTQSTSQQVSTAYGPPGMVLRQPRHNNNNEEDEDAENISTWSAINQVVGEAPMYSGPDSSHHVLAKIGARLKEFYQKYDPTTMGKRRFAVLVGGGSFNPLTRMHLRTYFLAKQCLESRYGFVVLGSLLSPAHPDTVRERYRTNPSEIFPPPHRLAVAQLLVQNSKLLTVDPWEITRRRPMDYLSVLEHAQQILSEVFPNVEIKILYVCKANMIPKLSPNALRDQNFGVVSVCRTPESDNLRSNLNAKWNGMITVVEDTAILDASLDVVTSRKVRDKIKAGQSVDQLVGEKINEYVNMHRIGPKMNGQEKWDASEKILPAMTSRPAAPALTSQWTKWSAAGGMLGGGLSTGGSGVMMMQGPLTGVGTANSQTGLSTAGLTPGRGRLTSEDVKGGGGLILGSRLEPITESTWGPDPQPTQNRHQNTTSVSIGTRYVNGNTSIALTVKEKDSSSTATSSTTAKPAYVPTWAGQQISAM